MRPSAWLAQWAMPSSKILWPRGRQEGKQEKCAKHDIQLWIFTCQPSRNISIWPRCLLKNQVKVHLSLCYVQQRSALQCRSVHFKTGHHLGRCCHWGYHWSVSFGVRTSQFKDLFEIVYERPISSMFSSWSTSLIASRSNWLANGRAVIIKQQNKWLMRQENTFEVKLPRVCGAPQCKLSSQRDSCISFVPNSSK